MPYLIAVSLLAADMSRLGEEISQVVQGGADLIHFDVMDNHYVPNLTIGAGVCASLIKRFPDLQVDVHLMASPVDALITQFAEAGAKRISIHPDATIHLERSLQLIHDNGCEAGIVLNPATSPDCLQWVSHQLDFVLVMTVNPGFGGQKLIPACVDKIAYIHQHFPDLPIAVDGGVSAENIAKLAAAGATQFIAGSAIFNSDDYADAIKALRQHLPSS